MSRLGTRDDAPAACALPPALITRALGDLVTERHSERGASVAVEQLCSALVADAPRLAQGYVDRLMACGIGVEALYDTYIPRVAQRLGDRWLDDTLSFASVTLGMARLTEIFRGLSPLFLRGGVPRGPTRHALFALAPGETHALGVVMAADYFQRKGWSVRVELRCGVADLVRLARAQDFDLIGISAGSDRLFPVIADAVAALRPVIRPGTPIVLGGCVACDDAAAHALGADLASNVASVALAEVERGF